MNTYAPKSPARIDKVIQYNTYKDRSKLKLIITNFLTFYIINMNFDRDFSHFSNQTLRHNTRWSIRKWSLMLFFSVIFFSVIYDLHDRYGRKANNNAVDWELRLKTVSNRISEIFMIWTLLINKKNEEFLITPGELLMIYRYMAEGASLRIK